MTAQVLIITKESVVCSSDQAATMSDGKTYDGMRKIFKLSDLLPAEIMFNGNADFENFSMETLISKFTNTVDFEKLETIEKVKDEFVRFFLQILNQLMSMSIWKIFCIILKKI